MTESEVISQQEPVSNERYAAALRAQAMLIPEALVAFGGVGLSVLTLALTVGAKLHGVSFDELLLPIGAATGELFVGTGAWVLGMNNIDRKKQLLDPNIPNGDIPEINTKAPDGNVSIGLFGGPRRKALHEFVFGGKK